MWKRNVLPVLLVVGFLYARASSQPPVDKSPNYPITEFPNYPIHSAPVSSAEPSELPAGPMKEKAETACAECHDAHIIVQQRLSKAAWTREVDKMVKWGAVVDPKDRDALIDYLSANFGADKPPYVPVRSTPVANSSKK